MAAWKQKSDAFLANASSEDIQINSQCIVLEGYECAYSCTDDPTKKADLQRAINECKKIIQDYKSQGIHVDCDNLNSSVGGGLRPSVQLPDFPNPNPDATIHDFYKQTKSPSNGVQQGWEVYGLTQSERELADAVGQLVDGLFQLGEENRQQKLQEMKLEQERRRQEQIKVEQEAAERARLTAMQAKRDSFIMRLEHTVFPFSAPYPKNYFFFISKDSPQALELSTIFEVPAKANQQLPYRSDIVTDIKNKTRKKNIWIRGVYESVAEAQLAQITFKKEAENAFLGFQPEIEYTFRAGYSTFNSNKTSDTNSESFWGKSKEHNTKELIPETSMNREAITKSNLADHPFYSKISIAEFPEKAYSNGNYCFFLVPQTERAVVFSNVFELPKKSEEQLPTESELLSAINREFTYSDLYLLGVFKDLTQAQLVKQEMMIAATEKDLQLGKDVYYIYTPLQEADPLKNDDSFWGVKKKN